VRHWHFTCQSTNTAPLNNPKQTLAFAPSLHARSGVVPHLTSISSPAKVGVPPDFGVGGRGERKHDADTRILSRVVTGGSKKSWAQKTRRDTRTSECLPDPLESHVHAERVPDAHVLRRASRGACLPTNATHSAGFTEQSSAPVHKSVPHVRKKNCERKTRNGHDRVSGGPPAFCLTWKKGTVVCNRHSECSCERHALKKYSNTIQEKSPPRPKITRWTTAAFARQKNPVATYNDHEFWAPSRRGSWQLPSNDNPQTLRYNCSRPRQHAVQGHTNL